jgi:hypothetical protein
VDFELVHTPAAGSLPANELRPRLRIVRPADAAGTVVAEPEMRQTGPGRYAATVELLEQGTYLATALGVGETAEPLARLTVTTGHPPEIAEIGFDEGTLSRLAAGTGGKFLYSLNELTGWGTAPGYRRPLAAWALAAAFVFAALDVLLLIAVRKGWL